MPQEQKVACQTPTLSRQRNNYYFNIRLTPDEGVANYSSHVNARQEAGTRGVQTSEKRSICENKKSLLFTNEENKEATQPGALPISKAIEALKVQRKVIEASQDAKRSPAVGSLQTLGLVQTPARK